jgi:hypothetical protein
VVVCASAPGRADGDRWTLVAGVFKPEQKLLAWMSTNPIDMAQYSQYLTLTPNAPDKDQVTGWIADLTS